MFLSVELNFSRPISPEVYLLAKLFQNIELNGSPSFRKAGRVPPVADVHVRTLQFARTLPRVRRWTLNDRRLRSIQHEGV